MNMIKSINEFLKSIKSEQKVMELCYEYNYEYYYDDNKKLYVYELTCDDYKPTIGYSIFLYKARMIAFKEMLFNIENNVNNHLEIKINCNEEIINNEMILTPSEKGIKL